MPDGWMHGSGIRVHAPAVARPTPSNKPVGRPYLGTKAGLVAESRCDAMAIVVAERFRLHLGVTFAVC